MMGCDGIVHESYICAVDERREEQDHKAEDYPSILHSFTARKFPYCCASLSLTPCHTMHFCSCRIK